MDLFNKEADLLDWLAGQALAALLANPSVGLQYSRERLASEAYALAEEMMENRKKRRLAAKRQ
jgi:hypothetical protein